MFGVDICREVVKAYKDAEINIEDKDILKIEKYNP